MGDAAPSHYSSSSSTLPLSEAGWVASAWLWLKASGSRALAATRQQLWGGMATIRLLDRDAIRNVLFVFRVLAAVSLVIFSVAAVWFLAWKLVLSDVPLIQEMLGLRKKPRRVPIPFKRLGGGGGAGKGPEPGGSSGPIGPRPRGGTRLAGGSAPGGSSLGSGRESRGRDSGPGGSSPPRPPRFQTSSLPPPVGPDGSARQRLRSSTKTPPSHSAAA